MIQLKDLYRKLAALLAEIDKGRHDTDYLLSVLTRLEHSFIRDLHITRGRLYAEDQGEFLPVRGVQDSKPVLAPDNHALDAEAAKLVTANGIYIYNDPSLAIRTKSALEAEDTVLAAFTVQDPSRHWIYIFALESGWVREEVDFCLKAVRSQLNFQLHIDAMDDDVQQAAIIQRNLVSNSVPLIAGYETAGCSQPADIMGGDFFDFSILDEDSFTVAVGDVSGHGLPAALLVRDVVTGLRMGVEREMRMAEAIQKLNGVLHRSTLSTNFVSLFFAEIESTGNILYVNAGHPPPLLVHGSTVKRLEPTGMVLGVTADTPFRRASANLAPGTVLVMYSDGAIERQREHEEFGLDRLEEILIRHQDESATAILDVLHRTITAFGNPSRFEDDLTLVIIKRVSS